MEGLVAWTSSRAAARAFRGAFWNVGVVWPYVLQAALAAWAAIRTAEGVGGYRAHREQLHGPRWVGWQLVGSRHLGWRALLHSAHVITRGRFRFVKPYDFPIGPRAVRLETAVTHSCILLETALTHSCTAMGSDSSCRAWGFRSFGVPRGHLPEYPNEHSLVVHGPIGRGAGDVD